MKQKESDTMRTNKRSFVKSLEGQRNEIKFI